MSDEKRRVGFAVMDTEQHRAISRKGGTMGHLKGTAHCWSLEECRIQGQKGGWANRGKPKPWKRAEAKRAAAAAKKEVVA